VTKVVINLVTPKAAAKQELLFNTQASGDSSCQFLPPGASMGLRYVLQLLCSEKSQIFYELNNY
jgi:hypothetical protein